ncbi:MAG: DNA-directed RNA polymerase subunit omega [Clostridia bacterium]|nr:DNA-directed RNA polymerase subunit omega [Clostridia bacterium]
MIYPAINDIMKAKNIDSKYTLVVATAKRAREINQTKVNFTECKSDKAVTIALHEIYENKVNFKTAEKSKMSESDTIMNHILEEDLSAALDAEINSNSQE